MENSKNNLKDGIYMIQDDPNPYVNFMVVKTYGDVVKVRKMTTKEECEQQIREWNYEFGRALEV